jgi:hypothetical protein
LEVQVPLLAPFSNTQEVAENPEDSLKKPKQTEPYNDPSPTAKDTTGTPPGHNQDTISHQKNAKCMQIQSACKYPHLPPDLQKLIELWPNLPEAIKAGIMAMVKSIGK